MATFDELMAMLAKHKKARKGARNYEQNVFDEFKSLARKYGPPERLTRAKFKHMRKLCRNATFAGSGEYQHL